MSKDRTPYPSTVGIMGRPKKSGGMTLAKDSDGTILKDIGYYLNGTGKRSKRRFWFGKDEGIAPLRILGVERCWAEVEKLWQSCRDTEEPLWCETTFAIAKAVGRGERFVRLAVPADVVADVLAEGQVAVEETVGVWLSDLRQRFVGVIAVALEDEGLEARIAKQRESLGNVHREEAAYLNRVADRLQGKTASSQTLHQALTAYGDHVKATKTANGNPTQNAIGITKRLKTIAEHQEDMPLSSFDLDAIEKVLNHWRTLPMVKVSRPGRQVRCSDETARNNIKTVRAFIRWLHKAKEWTWRKPDDYEVTPVQIVGDYDDDDTTLNSEQVETYTTEELRILWEYATPRERFFIVLALNCGFGNAEIASLKTGQIHLNIVHPKFKTEGSFIGRNRRKTKTKRKRGVYSEWVLWETTCAAIRWYQSIRPQSDEKYLYLTETGKTLAGSTKGGNRKQVIPSAFSSLIERIRKDYPEFRALSFNKLRKTSTDAIRQIAGGEVGGVFGGRGKPCNTDDQLERYSNKPFLALFAAIQTYGEQLASVFAPIADPFPAGKKKGSNSKVSVGKRKQVKELRAAGVTLKDIAARTGVHYATVRYILDQDKAKKAPATITAVKEEE